MRNSIYISLRSLARLLSLQFQSIMQALSAKTRVLAFNTNYQMAKPKLCEVCKGTKFCPGCNGSMIMPNPEDPDDHLPCDNYHCDEDGKCSECLGTGKGTQKIYEAKNKKLLQSLGRLHLHFAHFPAVLSRLPTQACLYGDHQIHGLLAWTLRYISWESLTSEISAGRPPSADDTSPWLERHWDKVFKLEFAQHTVPLWSMTILYGLASCVSRPLFCFTLV